MQLQNESLPDVNPCRYFATAFAFARLPPQPARRRSLRTIRGWPGPWKDRGRSRYIEVATPRPVVTTITADLEEAPAILGWGSDAALAVPALRGGAASRAWPARQLDDLASSRSANIRAV